MTARHAVPALALALAVAGCAGGSRSAGSASASALLARADQQMSASQYRSAATLYDEFLRAHPGDADAARVRATRTLLDRLLVSQTEVERLQREVDRLKADLERLRSIDLRQQPGTR